MNQKKRNSVPQLKRRIERIKRRCTALALQSQRLTRYRLWALSATVLVVALALNVSELAAWLVLTGGGIGFAWLVWQHRKVVHALRRHRIWTSIKQQHLAKVERNWEGIRAVSFGQQGDHPFAADLHLVGQRSLHQLLNVAISRGGSQRLGDWLLNTKPHLGEIERRQALVQELQSLDAFRDKLTMHAILAQRHEAEAWDGDRIQRWLRSHDGWRPPFWLIGALILLPPLYIGLLLLGQAIGLSQLWIAPLLAYVAIYLGLQRHITPVLHEAAALENLLIRVASGFRYVERQRFSRQPLLKAMLAPLLSNSDQPSKQIKRLARITAAASIRGNPLAWLLVNLVMPWDVLLLHRLHQCKAYLANAMPQWLDVWYELEALCSLSNFANLNPNAVFPTVVEHNEKGLLDAAQIGHPLLPPTQRVCNDFKLDAEGQLALITGSNMSGKSTFLRTLGINLVLAYAGAPVIATHFLCRLMRVFACIQVSDSLADGLSYFYAEVQRLKQLLLALEQPHKQPLMYLIDEIFRGTNNRERLIGSRSYVATLVDQAGVGLLSTHDLELVQLAEQFKSIRNYHFRETIERGKMQFDYQLRQGPCPTTNALDIMRLEGLPVSDDFAHHSPPPPPEPKGAHG